MVTSLSDAQRIRVIPLGLPRQFSDFLGAVPKDVQWTMLLYGASFSGKSSFALKLANIFSRFGNILFVNAEENLAGGTIQMKTRALRVFAKNLYFLDYPNIEKIRTELKTDKYKFCFIDSLSALSNNLTEAMELFHLKNEFQNVSFVFIVHSDKTEQRYLGPASLKHNVDIAIEVIEKNAITIKNRFKKNNRFNDLKIFRN